MNRYAEAIENIMSENNLFGEIVEYSNNKVAVEIFWGDWKHEHLRLEWLVRENIPELKHIEAVTTEEDGSDCYSAVHKFFF